MPPYVSLISYTDQGIRNIKDSPKRLDAAKKLLKDLGGDGSCGVFEFGVQRQPGSEY